MQPQDSTPEPRYCACGCGAVLPVPAIPSATTNYVIGHYRRVALMRCKKCGQELPRTEFAPRFRDGRLCGVEERCHKCIEATALTRQQTRARKAAEAAAKEAARIARIAAAEERRQRIANTPPKPPKPPREIPEPELCLCGCGKRVNPLKPGRNRIPKYCTGHRPAINKPEYLVDETTGCWVWQRSKNERGYGKMNRIGQSKEAHRAYYELLVGPIPEGMEIDHVWARGCRHHDCVNPDHLEAVTPLENKLRSPNHILNREIAERIRALKGIVPAKQLATEFGVSRLSIHNVWNKVTWFHEDD